MNPTYKHILIGLIAVAFATLCALLLLTTHPIVLLFSVFSVLILVMQVLGYGPAAFMMTGFSVFIGFFTLGRLPNDQVSALGIMIVTLFVALGTLHAAMQKAQKRDQIAQDEDEQARREIQSLSGEVGFYEKRRVEMEARGEQRRRLARAANELGALLDPAEIQRKLIDLTGSLFPDRTVMISYGQQNDPLDAAVIQRRQAISTAQGLAVPIIAQQAVAGVLRVTPKAAGAVSKPNETSDLRLLEIVCSLASLALDNSYLFGQIQDTALRDGLTGLLTHRAFQDQLEAQLLEASRYNQPLSVILADVDHFKRVNDQHGHQAGDQVLQGFSHVLVRNVRDVDIVARYGGEEFVVILLQTPHAHALAVAEEIRNDFASHVFEVGGSSLSVTASFGVATFPADATSAQQLVRQADQRLYKSKQNGRNQVRGQ